MHRVQVYQFLQEVDGVEQKCVAFLDTSQEEPFAALTTASDKDLDHLVVLLGNDALRLCEEIGKDCENGKGSQDGILASDRLGATWYVWAKNFASGTRVPPPAKGWPYGIITSKDPALNQ